MSEWNDKIIAEFRQNGGRVGGRFEGTPLLLLHHTGAKSGTERLNPLAYQPLGDGRFAIFASKGGAPTNPDWYYNLLAHPRAKIEVGAETFDVIAHVAAGDERTAIWEKQKALNPGFASYEQKTDREIPVIVLDPVMARV